MRKEKKYRAREGGGKQMREIGIRVMTSEKVLNLDRCQEIGDLFDGVRFRRKCQFVLSLLSYLCLSRWKNASSAALSFMAWESM